MAVGEPFGRGPAAHYARREITHGFHAELPFGALAEVDTATRTAITTDGDRPSYDAPLVCTGARSESAFAAR
jgi:NADPH-dependent 2,4-dienoyl-CoA reductase/sulfur reductase-like enzyme